MTTRRSTHSPPKNSTIALATITATRSSLSFSQARRPARDAARRREAREACPRETYPRVISQPTA
ncbi:hypothetical protein [Roseospira visakhapatnamensis]|uniref:Uncharacterized protein n=1 Tax=Roseospira visakhapatnamensis TaxID=390880 RepID=A0A7W6RI03_9PROT|nr:hypothetical protein [Roseospira visakhapatnamensis]MBB4268258.1 hypothetical protein [Roseospira visakhapatnamensis]